MTRKRVLFLCTGNSARSQMAEALLRHYAGDWFEVYSAGTEPKGVHPLTLRVLSEIGIDASQQTSKSLQVYQGKMNFDYLITVCADAERNCPYFPGQGMRLHWPFEDPAAGEETEDAKLQKFRRVRDQIAARIRAWLDELGLPTNPSE
ncbi:arsenate reductase ArsC [uncultured Thermanaerothrix sp.]|uniref:arsenate reductase ArsC n=1 Tax=uncultured Thermanaerothrix sp. TaxID=1195149 RepID=UPI002629CCEE|nr:arsenate reductase ArsC [uncultured Thermanaerothrix sp.]